MDGDAPAGAFRRYGLFFLIALALGLAPGPDILFVFAQSLAHGMLAGVYVTFGLCTGICLHVTLAAFGAGTFLNRHPRAYKAVTPRAWSPWTAPRRRRFRPCGSTCAAS